MVNNITILNPFLTRPYEKIHLAELSKLTNIPHPTARLWLKEFEQKGLIKKEIKGRLSLFYLNFEHPNILDYLTILEKDNLINKCEDLIMRELRDYFNQEDCSVIMFGSSVINIKKANDIDLVILGKYNKKKLKEFSKQINKKIHIINSEDFESLTETLRKEILRKHLFINTCEKTMKNLFGVKNNIKIH